MDRQHTGLAEGSEPTTPCVHLVKLFVGLPDFSSLKAFQAARIGALNPHTGQKELAHLTRHAPKRADELVGGGSIYWVMSGTIVARQRLTAFRAVSTASGARCAMVLDPTLHAVVPQPRRAFQGWRYLAVEDAPADVALAEAIEDLPPGLAAELARLGLG